MLHVRIEHVRNSRLPELKRVIAQIVDQLFDVLRTIETVLETVFENR
jgi:hypothetical protein